MKFNQFLLEMPTRIHQSKDSMKNLAYEGFKKMSKGETFGYIRDYKMIRSKDKFALVDEEKNIPLIYISYSLSNRPKAQVKEQYTQNLLWKDESITTTELDYFFMAILGEVGVIYSSDEQTIGGRKFWERIVKKYAGSRFFEIGYFDASTGRNTIVKKQDVEDAIKYVYDEVEYSKLYIKDLEQ